MVYLHWVGPRQERGLKPEQWRKISLSPCHVLGVVLKLSHSFTQPICMRSLSRSRFRQVCISHEWLLICALHSRLWILRCEHFHSKHYHLLSVAYFLLLWSLHCSAFLWQTNLTGKELECNKSECVACPAGHFADKGKHFECQIIL